MFITCEQCRTTFQLDDSRIKPSGIKVRCSQCRHVFRAYPHRHEETLFMGKADAAAPPSGASVESDQPAPRMKSQPPAAGAGSAVSDSSPDKSHPYPAQHTQYISFRKRLMYFAITPICILAALTIPIEFSRPVQELRHLIKNAQNLIAGVNATLSPEELERMNAFALTSIERDRLQDDQPNYYFLSFNMLITEGELLPEQEVLDALESFEKFGGKDRFSYDRLKETEAYWRKRFDESPGIYEIFKKNKQVMMKAITDAAASGFQLSGMMMMLDSGKQEGVFLNQIAYVVDSYPWHESDYPGELYEVEEEKEFWRQSALTGKTGFDHNPLSDPDRWYLPRFDTDEYGVWFSVWLTHQTGNMFNILSIDFNAETVKKLLLMVLAAVAGVTVFIFGFVLWIANRFSLSLTRPITELTRGAMEVARGNYEYEVPVIREDELGRFTQQFNSMARGQRERLNLMETMEKFLCKELAEKAAESGLVFGGQKADCTIMFTDFAGFSTITRKMSARQSVNVLNAYYEALIPIIQKYGGFTDKYIGDAIVAIFGAPIPIEDHAERAVACSIEMQWTLRQMNARRRQEEKAIFEMRIGLNSGEVIVGAIGCDKKLEYTSIGETTNLANRMETICDIGHIMMAEGTYQKIMDVFFKGVHIAASPDQISVKGYPRPVSAFRVYVDNWDIEKDIHSNDPLRSFYTYTQRDHHLRQHPDDVPGINFVRWARFL